MLRLDQVQRLIQQPRLFDEVGDKLGYKHLDWVSKDTDNQFSHYPRHYVQYDVPDAPNTYDWSLGISDAIKDMAGYKSYNDGLGDGVSGIYIVYEGLIRPNPDSPSGWSVLYTVSFVDPDMPLM